MKTLETMPTPAATSKAPDAKPRLYWVDNLRTLTIFLVVNMHACVTYSWVGSWYYDSPPEPGLQAKIVFAMWQAHLQAFFMGLLFFIAGFYADRSLARRGGRAFAVERLRRLGIPTLIYMLALQPLIVLGMHPGYPPSAHPASAYLRYLIGGDFISGSGPMWFAFALLIFSLVFIAIRFRASATTQPVRLTAAKLLALGLGVGIISFLIRLAQPLGTSILNFQLCYFAQYVVAFALGILVSRRDSLGTIAAQPVAKKAGVFALCLGPIALLGIVYLSLPLPKNGPPPFNGGWNPLALSLAVWEQVVGFALGVGAMAFCAAKLNLMTPAWKWLSDRAFAVYLLHPPILVAAALLLQPYRQNALIMAAVLTAIGLVSSFLVADLAKRIPGLRSVL